MRELPRAGLRSSLCRCVAGSLVFGSSLACATDLTVPYSFTAGNPAVAAEVNANFSAAATAVNSKQDRVTGTCPGQSIQTINANGTVTCASGPDSSGVEFVNDVGNVAITNADTTVTSIDVAVPTTGFLIATAMGSASCASATTLTVRLHNAATMASSPLTTFENRPTAIQGLTMLYFVHYVFAVSAGSNVVSVSGSCSIGTGAMNANTLSAIFVPNRY